MHWSAFTITLLIQKEIREIAFTDLLVKSQAGVVVLKFVSFCKTRESQKESLFVIFFP